VALSQRTAPPGVVQLLSLDQRIYRRDFTKIRRTIPPLEWERFANILAPLHGELDAPFRKPDRDYDRSLDDGGDFAASGLFRISPALSGAEAAEARRYFEALPVRTGNDYLGGDPRLRPMADVRREAQLAAHTFAQTAGAPHVLDTVNRPDVVDFIERQLGCVPTLYSLHAWWSFPAAAPSGLNMQYFHRDTDDWRFFTLFIYLTDVDDNSGPHQLIAGSHRHDGMTKLLDAAREQGRPVKDFDVRSSFTKNFSKLFSERCEQLFDRHIVSITGPAGSLFLANTLSLHRGLLPITRSRLVVWARFGLGPNSNSIDQIEDPIPISRLPVRLAGTPRNRYINRMIVNFDA